MTPKKKPGGGAPRPTPEGVEAKQAAVDLATQVMEITVKGESYGRLAYPSVPVGEIMAVRDQCGVSWSSVTGENGVEPDITTYAVLAWLAKRANGEPRLSWQFFLDTMWPPFVLMTDCSAKAVTVETDGDPDPQS